MAELTHIKTAHAAPPAGPYSQAIIAGPTIYLSGQIPMDSTGKLVESDDIGALTAACIDNIKAILKEAGSDISKVIKTTVFLTTMDNFPEMNKEYEKNFTHRPARSCVAVHELPKRVLVEIECIALKDHSGSPSSSGPH